MESPKTKKIRGNQEEERQSVDQDRLSSLPDSILSHILSFVDTKSAIKTSVLSKRYRLLWTLTPRLDFKVCVNSIARFTSFVDQVLARREPGNLITFRLSLHTDVDPGFVENCLAYAAQHKVKHLRLRCYTKQVPAKLPRLLLTSPSLTILRLNTASASSIALPKSFTLPGLKVLRLKNFIFSDKNYDGELFSGCPSLETLILNKCCIMPCAKVKVLNVNILELKNLEIRNWRTPWIWFDEHMINVTAPSLRSFKYRGHITKVNFKENLSCLDEVCIDLQYPKSCKMVDVNERRRKTSETFICMLGQLRNLKSLFLSQDTVEVLSVIPDLREVGPPIFENLRCIKFTAEDKDSEIRVRIGPLAPVSEHFTSMVLELEYDGSKDHQLTETLDCSKIKVLRMVESPIAIPANVVYYLLGSSPSADYLIVELPKVSLDKK